MEVMEAFKYTFSQPGAFTAALNYHRNGFSAAIKEATSNTAKIEKPILLIWVSASHDHSIGSHNYTLG